MNKITVILILVMVAVSLNAQSQTNVRMNHTRFEVDYDSIEIIPLSGRTARINGKFEVCEYESWETYNDKEYYDEWVWFMDMRTTRDKYREIHGEYPPKTSRWGQYYKRSRDISRTRNHQTGSYIPEHIKVEVPYCKELVYADVESDGRFSVIAELDDEHFFEVDRSHSLKNGYAWWQTKKDIIFEAEHPQDQDNYFNFQSFDYPAWNYETQVFFIDVSDTVVEELGSCLTYVEIEVSDMKTMVPIEAEVTITLIETPSFEEIQASWRKEYDEYIVERATEEYNKIKSQGFDHINSLEVHPNSSRVGFWAYRGAKYKIETRHKEYYYYSSVFEVGNNSKPNLIILLDNVN